MQQNILDAHPAADLHVYAIWMPILSTDKRSRWDDGLLNDPRVTYLWDLGSVAGGWFADSDQFSLRYPGPIMYDAFLLFGREARSDDAPLSLLAFRRTALIDTADALVGWCAWCAGACQENDQIARQPQLYRLRHSGV